MPDWRRVDRGMDILGSERREDGEKGCGGDTVGKIGQVSEAIVGYVLHWMDGEVVW